MARQDQTNDQFSLTSFLYGGNADYIEALHAAYEDDPASVDPEWQDFFASLKDDAGDVRKNARGASWKRPSWPLQANGELISALDGNWGLIEKVIEKKVKEKAVVNGTVLSDTDVHQATRDSVHAIMMIRAFRMRGHLHANLDPLGINTLDDYHELSPDNYGFTEADFDRPIFLDNVLGLEFGTVRQMLEILTRTYCSTLGVEFMHISDPEEKGWIQERIEGADKEISFTAAGKKAILQKLVEAEGFEQFIDVKYKGTKRFGLDGGEALIPALEQIVKRGGQLGMEDIVLGMAHRGRLNVLSQVMAKPHRAIFHEFKGGSASPDDVEGSGDVKYHLGASSDREFDGNKVHLSLTANPSHLEIVDPVVMGKARAKQDQLFGRARGEIVPQEDRAKVLPLLLHGDAAFAGQGVIAEMLGLSGLRGHRVAGSLHFIINNQIGFTTAPEFARSSVYATDVARMIQAPIFHVNGDDPEAVVRVGRLAYEYRQAFRKDVVIDLVCYRRRGHNETDNPSFTQPLMYDLIDAKRSVRKLYTEALIGRGDITVEEAEQALRDYQERLEQAFTETREAAKKPLEPGAVVKPAIDEVVPWSHDETSTGISEETVKRVVDTQLNLPEGFSVHPRLAPILQRRGQMVADDIIDWAMGETLAFGSLLLDGHPVRLVGQDSRRGTFGQRHAVLVDRITGADHTPLKVFNEGTTKFYVYDSLLSEFAAMGFEYGYSVVRPDALVAWEAQFGDFANGAQSIIDEFISAGEQKWGQRSSVVLLLPHGYEGQGPDHSSARIERFLQLCAHDNMTVAQPSTPANYFHLLRWQMLSRRHKPLIVFTPKSLLRHKAAASPVADFTSGSFRPVLGDVKADASAVRKIVLCSGRVYYDIAGRRDKQGLTDVAVVRLERLFPFPIEELRAELDRYSPDAELVWVQDEPINMGPWPYLALKLTEAPDLLGGRRPRRASRPANSSPAVGSHNAHEAELDELVQKVFN